MRITGGRLATIMVVLGAATLGASAAPAFGNATVRLNPSGGGRLIYQADLTDGVPSALSFTHNSGTGKYRVNDLYETLTPSGPYCQAVDTHTVDCANRISGRAVRRIEVRTGDGNDVVNANLDVPILAYGGTGNDTIVSGDSVDVVYGGYGDDTIDTNGGDDYVYGSKGKDKIEGGTGDDTLYGNHGKDNIKGNSGGDTIQGGDGNDTLRGNSGADNVYGGDGDDTLYGNGGKDLLKGGAGDDELHSKDGGTYDRDYCGSDTDKAFGDAGDLHSDCESFVT